MRPPISQALAHDALDRIAGAATIIDTKGGARNHYTDLGELLGRAQHAIKRRSVIFLVSDFVSRPGWERALGLLARKHEIVAVRLCDPLERE